MLWAGINSSLVECCNALDMDMASRRTIDDLQSYSMLMVVILNEIAIVFVVK